MQFEQKPSIFLFLIYIRGFFFLLMYAVCKDGPLIFFFLCHCCGSLGEDTTSDLSSRPSRTVACCDGFV